MGNITKSGTFGPRAFQSCVHTGSRMWYQFPLGLTVGHSTRPCDIKGGRGKVWLVGRTVPGKAHIQHQTWRQNGIFLLVDHGTRLVLS